MGDDSMPICVGINGFGPIGQAVLFSSFSDPLVTVTAINDASLCIEYIAYIIQHESHLPTETRDSVLVVGEYISLHGSHKIRVTQRHDLVEIGWREAGVAYVVECTGLSSTRERCWGHITGGARGVIIAGQSADAPTVVVGANSGELSRPPPVICAGLPTAVALAPLLRVLHDRYGVEECAYTAIHGMRPAEATAGRSRNTQDWRQTRAAMDSIIPYTHTGCKTMEKVLPALADRISGSAFQVPVTKGCAVDMLLRFSQPVMKEALDATIKEASIGKLSETLFYSNEGLISRDCTPNGKVHYDAISSQCLRNGEAHKLMLWFDPDWGYGKRILSLIPLLQKLSSTEKM